MRAEFADSRYAERHRHNVCNMSWTVYDGD
jgi:hypothetical protein